MKSIIFGFSRPKHWKPYAELIMKVDDINFSHAYTRFQSNRWGVSFIYQASGERTNFMCGEYFESINEIVEEYEISMPDDLEAKIGKLCASREGKPYGFLQIIGIGIVHIVYLVSKKRIKNPFADGDITTDCIEEQSQILRLGLFIQTPLDMDSVSVKPYHEWLLTIPKIKRVR